MALMTKRVEYRNEAGKRVTAVAFALMLATAGAWAGGGRDQDRPPTRPQQAVPDNDSVPPAARRSYEDFWKGLPKSKADALDRDLNSLEARQRRGDAVERDLERLRREYPELFQMSATLQSAKWIVSSGGSTQAATCTGLGWIGRNGRLRCIGRLTT